MLDGNDIYMYNWNTGVIYCLWTDGYGNWSSEGCEIDENYNDIQDEVTCFCDHLTSFSILLVG